MEVIKTKYSILMPYLRIKIYFALIPYL
jgi:hypothetical protein